MTDYIHGVHDIEGAELMADKPGWIVVTVAIGCDPKDHGGANFYAWTSRGFKVIVRLNNGYKPAGTIPTPDRYADFAQRCANFVGASPGVNLVIIGNEPNHSNEWPDGKKIDPADYARCYSGCRQAIQQVSAGCKVLVAGCAPWDDEAGMFWLDYWSILLNNLFNGADGFAIHAYTHGSDPHLITSDEIQNGCHRHFRVYRDQLARLQGAARNLPVYITETDQGDIPWVDVNSGWVQAAYAEIDAWNRADNKPVIHALCLYCSHNRDRWWFMDKEGVKADFRAAVAKGYTVMAPPTPPTPQPEPQPPTPPPAQRDIDPRLYVRGVYFEFIEPPAGTGYWRIKAAHWLDEQEADATGPDHHILGKVTRDGQQVAGIPFKVAWPSGNTRVTSKAPQPNIAYNYDFPMSSSLNEFSIQVVDGNPSDFAGGIGMGANGNPSGHTSTWIDWEWAIAGGEPSGPGTTPPTQPTPPVPPKPPVPSPATGFLLWPVVGPVTQRFGENPANYAKFGQAGHNGVDIGVPIRTAVAAIADGEVMFTGTDPDYGNYVRVYHESLHSHSFYAHLSEITVSVGQGVERGQTIALSGNSGNSTGPHLHLELRGGTRDAYYPASYGYSQGRYDPLIAYILTGSPLAAGAG